jgi:hypothetical protein
MNKEIKPIVIPIEANEVLKYLIDTTVKVLSITIDDATERVDYLMCCELLNGLNPSDILFQIYTDLILTIPKPLRDSLPIDVVQDMVKDVAKEVISKQNRQNEQTDNN